MLPVPPPFINLTEQQMDQINDLNIPGVYASFQMIPSEQQLATQLIGGLTYSDEEKKKRYKDRDDLLHIQINFLHQTLSMGGVLIFLCVI
mgnify:CR=1 FL=1